MRDADPAAEAGDEPGLCRGLRPQPVIDRHRTQHRTGSGTRDEVQKRHRVAATRDCDADRARAGQGKVIADKLEKCLRQRAFAAGPRHRHWQARAFIAVPASTASGAVGKRVPTSRSVTQASCACPSTPSAAPSFSSAAGARGPFGAPEKAFR